MTLLWEGIREAATLIFALDAMVLDATLRTLWISLLAVCLAAVIGLPGGTLLARRAFFGRRAMIAVARAGMAVPTVFLGIVCYALFSRRGPLGPMELLYTPWAIIAGEFLLALPIIVSIVHGAVAALDPRIGETAMLLGATALRRWRTYLSEARTGVILAWLSAFARCLTELGIAMMAGGNIKARTRTLSTATALETGKGEFGRGMAMGLILLSVSLSVAIIIGQLAREEPRATRR